MPPPDVLLAAWCPWIGIRNTQYVHVSRLLVLVGAVVAFVVRTTIVFSAHNPRSFAWVYHVLACIFLAILGVRAYVQKNAADAELEEAIRSAKTTEKDADKGAETEATHRDEEADVQWNSYAFKPHTDPEVEEQEEASQVTSYGALQLPPKTCDGVLSERWDDEMISLLMAPWLSLLLAFMCETQDKSEVAMLIGGHSGKMKAFAYILGAIPAIGIACFFGLVLERQTSEQKCLFFVSVGLFALWLVTISQALEHIPDLQVGPPAAPSMIST